MPHLPNTASASIPPPRHASPTPQGLAAPGLKTGGTGGVASGGATAPGKSRCALVALPRLAKSVPTAMPSPGTAAAEARVARFICDSGALQGMDMPSRWACPMRACEDAIGTWIAASTAGLRHLRQKIVMEYTPESGDNPPREGLTITTYASACPELAIGAGLEALEGAHAGLGRAAYHALNCQSAHAMYGPDEAFETAICYCWQGEEDESEVLSWIPKEADRQEFLASIVKRADYDASYPTWARPWFKPDAAPDLDSLAQRRSRSGEMAALVLRLNAATDAARRMRAGVYAAGRQATDDWEDWGQFAGYGALLVWRPGDITYDLYSMEEINADRSDCHDWLSREFYDMSDPAALASWRAQLALHLDELRLTDALLACVAAG